MRYVASGGMFSPTTSTLIYGRTESLLVDAQFMREDADELVELVRRSATALRTIYHAHADHYFGLDVLLERFPDARAVTLPSVAEAIRRTVESDRAQWGSWFAGAALPGERMPEPLVGDTLVVDGHQLHAIEVGQGDIPNITIVHVPEHDAVVAGDVAYNGIHAMLELAASGRTVLAGGVRAA